ncbi:MAG: DUF2815 family protein [Eubacteriales bacterium]|nr:DUF2815 family protein [Eubacteriales bacterium]
MSTALITGEGRFSYAHLTKPQPGMNGGAAKYRVTLLIPKSDTDTYNALKAAMDEAINTGISSKWNGKRPKLLKNSPLQDGDGVKESNGEEFGPECKGCWVLRASCDEDKKPVGYKQVGKRAIPLEPSEIYSGMYGKLKVHFYPYSSSGNNGISCSLDGYLKTKDGEAFGGGAPATAADFGLEDGSADFMPADDLGDL